MGYAIGRLALPMQGFVNQFLANLAPAITTVSNLIVEFFAKNTAGWTVAKTLADGLVFSIRMVVGAVTLLTGIFQVFMALGSQIGQMFSEVFSLILSGVSRVMKSMAALADAAGFDGLADSLAEGSRGARAMARGASEMGQMYGEEAANSFAAGVQNIRNPFAAFDAGFAQARRPPLGFFFMAFFKSLPPLSALLNSLATFIGTPTFLAKAGSCAAAAMRRACFADLLGISTSIY